MRSKRQAGAPPQVVEGEKTVIHVGADAIRQRIPRQLHRRPLSLLDVIGFAVMTSTAVLLAFLALAYGAYWLKAWIRP